MLVRVRTNGAHGDAGGGDEGGGGVGGGGGWCGNGTIGGGGEGHCVSFCPLTPVHKKRFGVDPGIPWIASIVAWHKRISAAKVGLTPGRTPRICAIAPATWGHDMDVPDLDVVAVSLSVDAARIVLPGAKISTQRPWFEKDDIES